MKSLNARVLALVSVITMLCVSATAAPIGSGLAKERYNDRRWRLTVFSDRFSGVRRCLLRSRDKRMTYVGHALAFRLREAASPSEPHFRVDNSAAQSVRDQLPELARLGVAFERAEIIGSRLADVVLPASLVADGHVVTISPKFGARPRRFNLSGFQSLHAKAVALSCAPGTWITR